MRAGLAVLAVAVLTAVALADVAASRLAPYRPVRLTWVCRVRTDPAQASGPACTQVPVTYRPPWPYLSQNGRVHYPVPAPGKSP